MGRAGGCCGPPGWGLSLWVSPQPDSLPAKGREQQLSNRSIVSLADSHTEFFDACEVFLSASSSENEVRGLGGRSAGVGGSAGEGALLVWGALRTPCPPLAALGSLLPSLSPVPPHQPAREPLPVSPSAPRSPLPPLSRGLRSL